MFNSKAPGNLKGDYIFHHHFYRGDNGCLRSLREKTPRKKGKHVYFSNNLGELKLKQYNFPVFFPQVFFYEDRFWPIQQNPLLEDTPPPNPSRAASTVRIFVLQMLMAVMVVAQDPLKPEDVVLSSSKNLQKV